MEKHLVWFHDKDINLYSQIIQWIYGDCPSWEVIDQGWF